MRYVQLGATGVRVSVIALGTATFGVAPLRPDAERLVAKALDLGVNVIDTANSYGNQPRFDRPGAPPAAERASAEEIIGSAIRGRRSEVVLCSKVMEPVGQGVNDRGLSRRHIFEQVEASLRRLGTDHLDVYYAHHPDATTPIEETIRAFDDLIRQGKIRYYALSTFPAWQMVEAVCQADHLGLAAPVCNQVPYNLSRRDLERDVTPVCEKYGLSLTVFSPLAGGLLAGSGAQDREFAGHKRWGGPGFSDDQIEIATQLDALAGESGHSPSALALGWLLSRPAVATAIIGPETEAELETAIAAVERELPGDLIERIDGIGKKVVSPWSTF